MTVKLSGLMLMTLLMSVFGGAVSGARADTGEPHDKPHLDTRALTSCGTTTASKALDGARFVSPEGQVVKLALVKAPELWNAGSKYQSWPYAYEARAALMAAITGQDLSLFCEGPRLNHVGELVAHVLRADGSWLQYDLVRKGIVLVFPRPTRRVGLPDLYRAELTARTEKAGLWAFRNLIPVDATSTNVRPGWFQIVSGTVRAADKVGPTIFLNFGDDWRSDFTVEIPASALTHFDKAGINALDYQGKRIEVRGWIDFKSGPRLLLQGPGQIRAIEDEPVKDTP